ncbi:MAG: hypothetical protein J5667_05060 [Bacteroidales bacterium]|nr:hypothetical protein [Bacteroidales bacterium]
MKNLFKLLAPVTVAATVLASCALEITPTVQSEAFKITVKANAQELENDNPETKTYIDGYTIRWGTGEYMKLAVTAGEKTVFANSTGASADAFDGDTEAMFEFSVDPGSAAEYVYQGLYPASAAATTSNNNPASYKVNLPTTQNASASSYDPAAYILVARPETFNSIETDWVAYFRRATALNKITLKNVPDGKSINKVKITATGKKLAGGRHFDLSTGQSSDIYGNEATIEVKYASALAGANVDVWFTSWGVDLIAGETLEIVAYTTDKKSYTKTITLAGEQKISFKEGCLNTLGANISGITPEDVTEIEEGNYVVLAKDGANYYALKAEKEDGKERLLSVAYEGSLASYLGDADIIWSLTKSGDSFIFENSSKYLGYKGSSNESYWLETDENWTETNYLLDVTAQGGASDPYYVTLHSNASRYLSKNSSSAFFAFYGNTGQKADIVFVPATVDTRTDVTLSFAEATVSFNTTNYGSFLGQDVTASPDVPAITGNLNWSKVDNDSVIDDFDEGVLTLTGNEGTATVTVSFDGDVNYKPATASYTIEVSDASNVELTESEITMGENTVKGTENGKLAYRLGTSSNNGSITFASGYSSITFRLEAYSNTPRTFSVTNGTISGESSLSPSAGSPNGTINADFSRTDTGTEYTIVVTDSSEEVVFSGRRGIVWGFTAVEAAPDTRADASLVWKKGGVAADSDTASIEDGDDVLPTIALDNSAHSHPVTYASSNTDVATIVASGVGAGTITLVAAGETTISAIFAGDENYKPLTVTYTLTVSDNRAPSYDFETVADLNGLVTSTSTSYNGYLTDAIVSFVPTTGTAFIKDATGSVMIYKSNHGLKQGQTYTGAISVTAIKYNNLYSEITAFNASFTGSENTVAPQNVALSDLIGNFDDYQNAYVQVAGLTVTAKSNKDITVTSDGNNSYVVFDNPGSATCAVGDVITVKGTVTKYNTTEEIKVWAAADITITSYAPRAVTFTQPTGAAATAGCSIAVTVGGNPHTSGNTVASGTTVTLTATAGTDYEFTSWSVSGATVADASATTTTFEMGTSAVSISATFTSTGGDPVDVTGPWATWASTSAFSVSNNTVNSKVAGDFCSTNATLKAFNSSGTQQTVTAGNSSSFYFVYFNAAGSSYWQVDLPVTEDIPSGTTISISYYHAVNSKGITSWTVSCNGNALGETVTINTNGSPTQLSDMTHVERSYTTTAKIDSGSTISFRITAGSGTAKNNRITNIEVSASSN